MKERGKTDRDARRGKRKRRKNEMKKAEKKNYSGRGCIDKGLKKGGDGEADGRERERKKTD